jgi:hypothetical protein
MLKLMLKMHLAEVIHEGLRIIRWDLDNKNKEDSSSPMKLVRKKKMKVALKEEMMALLMILKDQVENLMKESLKVIMNFEI